jgi:hypothetical protein
MQVFGVEVDAKMGPMRPMRLIGRMGRMKTAGAPEDYESSVVNMSRL